MLNPLGMDDGRLVRIPWASLGIAAACVALHLPYGTAEHGKRSVELQARAAAVEAATSQRLEISFDGVA
jgi:hypothetical protein